MVDKNQDSEQTPPTDDFPPLDTQPSDEPSADRPEAPISPPADQPEKPGEPDIKPGVKPKKQPPSLLIRTLRWILGILIVFGLGAVTAIYFGLIPAQDRNYTISQELMSAQQRNDELQSQAQQEQSNLQAEIDRLKTFEARNQELQTQLDQAELHVAILSAEKDVISAQLALEKEDTNAASLALSQTPETLDTISNMLESNQREVVSKMKDRLGLAVNGIDTNTYAALSDLDVLYNDLIKLENTFFSQP